MYSLLVKLLVTISLLLHLVQAASCAGAAAAAAAAAGETQKDQHHESMVMRTAGIFYSLGLGSLYICGYLTPFILKTIAKRASFSTTFLSVTQFAIYFSILPLNLVVQC